MDLRPIRTEADHRAAFAEIERLCNAVPDTPQGDRLDIRPLLVEAYEEQHHEILPPDPMSALEYCLDSRGLTRRDLEPYLGSPARVTGILSRRRALTTTLIRRLHQGLSIPAEVLIQPYQLLKEAA